ncbi:hypothetical protein [Yoonia sp.]|uniref:hypothetical protein n=1 Tax=Yoonia sp. TaxID=2212373 RepID=UPI00391A9DEF
MNRDEFKDLQTRVEARAARLWAEVGSPDGGHSRFIEQARELVALEEVDPPTRDPADAGRPVVEEAAIQENLGEFPGLRDQGDERTYPDVGGDPYAEDDIRLSDGDASDTGGMLPDDDAPRDDLPDVSVADADMTESSLDANDDPPSDDLNDDGIADPRDLDGDPRGKDGPGDIPVDPDNGDSVPVPKGYDDEDDTDKPA